MIKGHIYFKDKSGEKKGPFTEREVQEWYRKGWFDSQHVFYFSSDPSIDSDIKEYTLEDLRSINGYGCPFMMRDSQLISSNQVIDSGTDDYIQKMKEDLEELHMKYESMHNVEMRLKNIEDQLKAMSSEGSEHSTHNDENLSPFEMAQKNKVEQNTTDDKSHKYKRMSKKKRDKLKKAGAEDNVHEDSNDVSAKKKEKSINKMSRKCKKMSEERNMLSTEEVAKMAVAYEVQLMMGQTHYRSGFHFRPSLSRPSPRIIEKALMFMNSLDQNNKNFFTSDSALLLLYEIQADLQTGMGCCPICEFVAFRTMDFYEHFCSYDHQVRLDAYPGNQESCAYRVITIIVVKNDAKGRFSSINQ